MSQPSSSSSSSVGAGGLAPASSSSLADALHSLIHSESWGSKVPSALKKIAKSLLLCFAGAVLTSMTLIMLLRSGVFLNADRSNAQDLVQVRTFVEKHLREVPDFDRSPTPFGVQNTALSQLCLDALSTFDESAPDLKPYAIKNATAVRRHWRTLCTQPELSAILDNLHEGPVNQRAFLHKIPANSPGMNSLLLIALKSKFDVDVVLTEWSGVTDRAVYVSPQSTLPPEAATYQTQHLLHLLDRVAVFESQREWTLIPLMTNGGQPTTEPPVVGIDHQNVILINFKYGEVYLIEPHGSSNHQGRDDHLIELVRHHPLTQSFRVHQFDIGLQAFEGLLQRQSMRQLDDFKYREVSLNFEQLDIKMFQQAGLPTEHLVNQVQSKRRELERKRDQIGSRSGLVRNPAEHAKEGYCTVISVMMANVIMAARPHLDPSVAHDEQHMMDAFNVLATQLASQEEDVWQKSERYFNRMISELNEHAFEKHISWINEQNDKWNKFANGSFLQKLWHSASPTRHVSQSVYMGRGRLLWDSLFLQPFRWGFWVNSDIPLDWDKAFVTHLHHELHLVKEDFLAGVVDADLTARASSSSSKDLEHKSLAPQVSSTFDSEYQSEDEREEAIRLLFRDIQHVTELCFADLRHSKGLVHFQPVPQGVEWSKYDLGSGEEISELFPSTVITLERHYDTPEDWMVHPEDVTWYLLPRFFASSTSSSNDLARFYAQYGDQLQLTLAPYRPLTNDPYPLTEQWTRSLQALNVYLSRRIKNRKKKKKVDVKIFHDDTSIPLHELANVVRAIRALSRWLTWYSAMWQSPDLFPRVAAAEPMAVPTSMTRSWAQQAAASTPATFWTIDGRHIKKW